MKFLKKCWLDNFQRLLKCYPIKTIQALASITETEALFKYVLAPEPAQGIPDSSGRQISLAYEFLLR